MIRVMAHPSRLPSHDRAPVAFGARQHAGPRHERLALALPGVTADLQADAHWWVLDLARDGSAMEISPWTWLESARELPASVKLAVDRAGMRYLAIESPAGARAGFDAWRQAAGEGMDQAQAVLAGERTARGAGADADTACALPAGMSDGLDWPAVERADGSLGFDLRVSEATNQAIARLTPAGDLVVEVEVGRWSPETQVARDALALLFLLAGGATRLARPFGVTEGARVNAGFDVRFPAPVSAVELNHALHALAAAVELCAAEAHLVMHEEVARAFVARWSDAAAAALREKPKPRRRLE